MLIHQGCIRGKDLLNQTIDQIAVSSLSDVDLVLFVVDHKRGSAEDHVIEYFRGQKTPVFLVINKIDELSSKSEIDEIIMSYLGSYEYEGYFPISAKNQTYLNRLEESLVPYLPIGPKFYPSEMKSDQSEEQLMAEFIRERILFHTEQEVPTCCCSDD